MPLPANPPATTTPAAFKTWAQNVVDTLNGIIDGTVTVALEGDDEAYNATTWNGSVEVPTKKAVRDKIETLGSGAVRVEDEGSSVVAAATGINFAGAGVTVTDAGSNEALVTIGGGSSSGLLAVHQYTPAQTVLSTTSTSMGDVDATNMAVTFTAPASGHVLVRLSAMGDMNGAAGEGSWGLRESTTNLASGRVMRIASAEGYLSAAFYLTGVTAGSHTYKWSYAVAAGGQTTRIIVGPGAAAGDFPGGLLEVWSAP